MSARDNEVAGVEQAPDSEPGGGRAGTIRWRRSYDKPSVERFLVEVDEERARLEAEIEAARHRVAVATNATTGLERRAEASLGAIVLAAQQELAQIESEHDELIATIKASAEAEAARLLRAAEIEASAMRQAASSLASHIGPASPTAALPDAADALPRTADGANRVDVG